MTTAIRWLVVTVLGGHGLIHLLGAAKGLAWADVPQLREPIGRGAGALWLLAAVLVMVAAGLLVSGPPTWWWAVALGAAVVSQAAILTSWGDARAGTAVNVLLILAAAYCFASAGPVSFRAQWEDQTTRALAMTHPDTDVVTEADLDDLPAPLAAYLRHSGAVGQPHVSSFVATFHGRIRSGPEQAWMPFTGRQVNTYGLRPRRVFLMDAARSGLPVTVLHQFADTTATMRVRLLSLVPMIDARGPEMDRSETVTVFNHLMVLAPGAVVGAPIRWTAVDDRHVRGVFSDADQSVTAVLTFDADDNLVDFTSYDRSRASADGRSFTRLTWSTPLAAPRDVGGRRVAGEGEARWDAPPPEGPFTYLEYALDDIAYNPAGPDGSGHLTLTRAGTTPWLRRRNRS